MLLIRNANIKTMAGPDLKNGCLLLENGKIAAVGQTVDAPEGVETLDAQGRLLTPGCVEAPYRPRQRGHALGGHGL